MPPRPDLDWRKAPLTNTDLLATEHATFTEWYPSRADHNPALITRLAMLIPYYIADMRNMMPFMLSSPDVLDDDAKQWTPVRLLGKGGFGTVGYWRKIDETGKTIDEVAIKEQVHRLPHGHSCFTETAKMRRHGISEEAVFHAGLQVKEATRLEDALLPVAATEVERHIHVIPLRSYKYNEYLRKNRMYLLYAPNLTLDNLRDVYRAFAQPIPEAFIWIVFLSIALALKEQVGALPAKSVLYEWRSRQRDEKSDFIVHMDMKPLNILLDYAPMEDEDIDQVWQGGKFPRDPTLLYPRVYLTDYGIAVDSNEQSGPQISKGWGTNHYRPPEQLELFEGWEHPPNAIKAPTKISSDIWVLAKIILELMCRQEMDKTTEDLEKCDEGAYRGQGQHFITEGDINNGSDKVYSPALVTLVHDCLQPEIVERPSIDHIINMARMNVRLWKNEFRNGSPEQKRNLRLYFRDREIDLLPLAPGAYYPKMHPEDLYAIKYRNPEVSVHLPAELWGRPDQILNYVVPQYNKDIEFRDGRIHVGGHESSDAEGPPDPAPQPPANQAPPPDAPQPPEQPPDSPGSVASDDGDVQALVKLNIKEIRARLRRLDDTAKLAGKGVTKKALAKKLVRLERRDRRGA